MPSICILTPDPSDPAVQGRWPEVFARMAAPLEAQGATVEPRGWTQAGDLTGFDLILPLMVWGNYRAVEPWLAAVDDWDAAGLPLLNPPSVLRWNVDKIYLQRLKDNGAPIAPTAWLDAGDPELAEAARQAHGWDEAVIKPRRSGGSYRTERLRAGQLAAFEPFNGPAMLQPFLPAVGTTGETSLVYFNGVFSHAVAKVARAGDFRVQPDWGGHVRAVTPDPDEFAAAEAALAAIDEGPLLYARVDLVRDLQGRPVVMELELLEPDLYLGEEIQAQTRFAEAVMARL
jgi:glutathione synthase/RimK-type ligase-like ATP-grasp enzyme